MSYPKIIAAICHQLQYSYGIRGDASVSHCNDVAHQILQCQAVMPDYLRTGMRLLTWLFDFCGLITSGSRFHRMPTELQRYQLDSWANSRLETCRSFVQFYTSLYLRIVMAEDGQ